MQPQNFTFSRSSIRSCSLVLPHVDWGAQLHASLLVAKTAGARNQRMTATGCHAGHPDVKSSSDASQHGGHVIEDDVSASAATTATSLRLSLEKAAARVTAAHPQLRIAKQILRPFIVFVI